MHNQTQMSLDRLLSRKLSTNTIHSHNKPIWRLRSPGFNHYNRPTSLIYVTLPKKMTAVAKDSVKSEEKGFMFKLADAAASPLTGIALMISTSQIVKRVFDLEDPRAIFWYRVAFVTSQALQLSLLLVLRNAIQRSSVGAKVAIDRPANPLTGEISRREYLTERDYDLEELSKAVYGIIQNLLVIFVLHHFMKAVQPLIIQAILPWRVLLTNPVVRIRLFGQKITRPFKPPSDILGEMLKGPEVPFGEESARKNKKNDDNLENDDEDGFDVPPSIEEVTTPRIDVISDGESETLRKRN